jgi:hypothetical protein
VRAGPHSADLLTCIVFRVMFHESDINYPLTRGRRYSSGSDVNRLDASSSVPVAGNGAPQSGGCTHPLGSSRRHVAQLDGRLVVLALHGLGQGPWVAWRDKPAGLGGPGKDHQPARRAVRTVGTATPQGSRIHTTFGGNTMNAGVNDLEWLTAVSKHPETTDNDLRMASALVLSDAHQAEDVDGMHWIEANFSIGRLQVLGFLEETVTVGAETIYELRIPPSA